MEHIRDSTGVGEICKNVRLRVGLTREDFSNLIGFSSSLLYQFESGKNDNAMIMLSYYRLFNEDDWKAIFKEVDRQNAYATRRLANGRGRDIKTEK